MAQGTTKGVPIDIDPLLAADSDLLVPSQKAIKTYADTKISSVSATSPMVSTGGTSPTLSIPQATSSANGYLSSSDWSAFNGKVSGTGTTNYVPKWTGSTALGNSLIYDSGTNVGIGTASPSYKLQVAGDIGFTAGANRYIRLANPAASGSANHIIIQGASANTSGTGGNIYLYEGSGAGGPGPGSIYIGATTGWTTTYITGQATISSTGPNTGTVFQVNAGGQNGLTINWNNTTPFMGYGLVVNRQSRFYNSSSYTFDNNVIIGSNTNAGYKLDVNGTQRVNGAIYLGTGTAGIIQGGTGIDIVASYSGGQGYYVNFVDNNYVKRWARFKYSGSVMSDYEDSPTTVNGSVFLQLNSTTRGFLPPRMTNAQRTAIATPAVGLIVYCTDATEGLYIYKSTGWTFII